MRQILWRSRVLESLRYSDCGRPQLAEECVLMAGHIVEFEVDMEASVSWSSILRPVFGSDGFCEGIDGLS